MRWRLFGGGLGSLAVVVVAVVSLMAGLGRSQPAELDPGCAAAVVSDWADDGRLDGVYDAGCYRTAIRRLPEDLRAYSTAPDDLERALQSTLRG